MVVSKRCKICAVLDANNIPISGEYFGKLLPKLVERICGIELDERKINGVLICVHCAIELVLTDVVIDKLRNSVQRLKKNVRETKPKTPSKEPNKKIVDNGTPIRESKKDVINCTASEETFINGNGETKFQKISEGIKPLEDTLKTITPKKAARRKSEFPDSKNNKSLEVNTDKSIFKKIPDNETSVKDIHEKSEINTDKSIFKKIPDNETFMKDTQEKNEVNTDKSINKNILDKETFIKDKSKKDKKRKPDSIPDSIGPDDTDNDDSKLKKRQKTTSLSVADQSLMDLTIDDQDLDVTNTKQAKVINCVICGKSFNKKSLLRDHFDACHMGERLKECPHCSIEFRSQQKYDSHIFSEKCKNTLHPCQYPKCNKHFKTVHKMELHMQEKHSSQNESETD